MSEAAEFLKSQKWQRRFEEDTVLEGGRLKAKVQDISWESFPEGGAFLKGEWRGKTGEAYHPEISLWREGEQWMIETECRCEARFSCVHAAAVLHRVTQPHILEKLLLTGSLKTGRSEPHNADEDVLLLTSETPRLRVSPLFSLHLKRVDHYPEVVRMYLQKKRPSWKVEDAESVAIALATVSYEGEEESYQFPLLSHITEGETVVTSDGHPLIIERFQAIERDAVSQLSRCGLMAVASEPMWKARVREKKPEWLTETYQVFFPDPDRSVIETCWLDVRNAGVPLLEKHGWRVEMDEDFGFEVEHCNPEDWKIELKETAGGWFSLSVGFELKGKTLDLLPILSHLLKDNFLMETLDRPDNGTQYALLPNGKSLELPIGRVREILQHLAKFIDPKFPGKSKLHALDAVALAEEIPVTNSADLSSFSKRIQEYDQDAETRPPEGLQATLRDYQLTGLRWMQSLRELGLNGILADDMGLGKTMQSLAHIMLEIESGRAQGADAPALIIAPTSVVTNWEREARVFCPHLKCLILQGSGRSRYVPSIPHSDLVLTSYALLHRDIETLKKYAFHLVILDEAQYIKNPSAKSTQAANELRATHKLCLSGTPVENNLGEFWSLMRFLMPGLLGSQEAFNSYYRTPIENHGDEEKRHALKARVDPLILRRTKDEVAKELPPKTELIHRIELTTAQKDLYETIRATMDKKIRQAIAVRGIEASQMFFLSALLKLRQICCHPALLEDAKLKEESAKLEFTLELMETLLLEGRKILLFSQFTSMLDMISTELEKRAVPHLMLTGATKNRGDLVENFQSGKAPVFLISLKAGGTGLTLTEADTVIHYDPWWNPAVERQATDRAYRIGQEKPVFVHKLICQDTVEEKIHTLQQKKGDLADALLTDSDTLKLTPESLKNLLAE